MVSGSYYRAIQAGNAELVTERITAVTPAGIQTADGRHRPADVIVLATGFQAHNYMRPMKVTGRDGLTIDKAWAAGPRAYRMTAIPGFPNLFTVLGPNSPRDRSHCSTRRSGLRTTSRVFWRCCATVRSHRSR